MIHLGISDFLNLCFCTVELSLTLFTCVNIVIIKKLNHHRFLNNILSDAQSKLSNMIPNILIPFM